MKNTTPTWYRSLKGWKYELLEEMEIPVEIPKIPERVIANGYITLYAHRLRVHTRYAWDGPSGPTFDTPTNMRASLFHDALCQLIGEGLLDKKYRKYADELLRTHMLEDQVLYADGILQIHVLEELIEGKIKVANAKKMTGWKRTLYLRWGRFRADGYYLAVRAWSKLKGM